MNNIDKKGGRTRLTGIPNALATSAPTAYTLPSLSRTVCYFRITNETRLMSEIFCIISE